MPIDAQNIVYFNNIQANHPAYISILPDYINKNIQCKLNQFAKNIHIFQKKWILQSADKQKELELFNEVIDFSLAKKYPIISCESILFDGTLYRKEKEVFSDFLTWKNLSPGISFYNLSNISEFSISDFFGKKSNNSFYFCESLSNTEYEKKFCSLLDPETGQIEKKNSDSQMLYQLLDSEKYRIFNVNVGIKDEKNIELKNNVKFVLTKPEFINENGNIAPNIEIIEQDKLISLSCNTSGFLYNPNSKKYVWYENGKKILDENSKILSSKKIIYGNNYTCEDTNGTSNVVKIDNKNLKIIGKKQIYFQEKDNSISEIYYTNTNLDENKINWICSVNNNLSCKILRKDNKVQITIEGLEKIKQGAENTFVTLKLENENQLIEKEIVLYYLKSDKLNLKNISADIDIQYNSKDDTFECRLPSTIKDKTDFHVKWFLNEQELSDNRDYTIVKNNQFNGFLNCIVYGKDKEISFLGSNGKKLVNLNEKNPSWLKEAYLYNPEIKNKILLFQSKKNNKYNKLECFILNSNADKITDNICKQNKNGFYEIDIKQIDFGIISDYLMQKEIFDIFNIPNFPLLIRYFENKKVTDYYSNFKIVVPNYKPVILFSGITNMINDIQKCYVVVYDPQNLFLTIEFTLGNNKVKKFFTPFDNINQKTQQEILKNKINNLEIYEYKFKLPRQEDSCSIIVSNGTESSSSKAKLVSEKEMLNEFLKLKDTKIKKNNLSSNLVIYKKDKSYHAYSKKLMNNFENIKTDFKIDENKKYNKSLFKLEYNYKDSKTFLSIYFPIKVFNDGNQIEKKDFFFDNQRKNEKDFSNLFFSARLYQDAKKNNRFYCEVTSNDLKDLKDVNFSIFLNSELLQVKNGDMHGVFFDIDNYKNGDNVICQVDSHEKYERASFNQKDESELKGFCIARDLNNSIIKFPCPSLFEQKRNTKEIKSSIKEYLIQNYKNYNNIDAINVTVWSISEKNKYSISMNFKNILEEF